MLNAQRNSDEMSSETITTVFVGNTQLYDGQSFSIGGKYGHQINDQLIIGAVGMIGAGLTDLNGNEYSNNGIGMVVGGLFFEHVVPFDRLVYFTLPVNFMTGGVTFYEHFPRSLGITQLYTTRASIFIIEPGINWELNISETLIPYFGINYRFALVQTNQSFDNSDVSGPSIQCGLKMRSREN